MPNALSTLKYFANENIPMFLVTGSPIPEVDYILKRQISKNILNLQ